MAGFEPVIAIDRCGHTVHVWPTQYWADTTCNPPALKRCHITQNPPRTGYEIFGLWTLRFDYEYQSDYSIAELLSLY
jgi:hypothetical protein